MPESRFLFVCAPSSLCGTPSGWAREMLEEGEVALLASEGIDAVNAVAHDLGQTSIELIRAESTAERQVETIIQYAGSMPLIWVDRQFTQRTRKWAHDRGPMTLLAESSGPLDDTERRRIDRFVAILGRQSE